MGNPAAKIERVVIDNNNCVTGQMSFVGAMAHAYERHKRYIYVFEENQKAPAVMITTSRADTGTTYESRSTDGSIERLPDECTGMTRDIRRQYHENRRKHELDFTSRLSTIPNCQIRRK